MRRSVTTVVVALVLSTLAGAGAVAADDVATVSADDAVVVAVIDSSFNPYHWDFLGSRMPQHLDADPANDLPLHEPPGSWLPGFPDPSTFATYQPLDLLLEEEYPDVREGSLRAADGATWAAMPQSDAAAVHYNWIPRTKFIGALRFGDGPFQGGNGAHGAGTSSVSVGNFHGTCPECLLVAITHGGDDREAAINWAMQQSWIDVVTNSYGYSLVMRDRLYSGSDVDAQKAASQRGQHIFFSAGNGQANTFTVPNTTLFSSQEGPDWITTVGATSPNGGQYTGAGKPADIAAVGLRYPSIGGSTVSGEGQFGGTSNATPVVAGMYARGLWWARERLGGPSRVQHDGVVAAGHPVACGAERPDCELGDGVLTQTELRTRLYQGAVRTPQGPHVSAYSPDSSPVSAEEYELAAEGHGTYWARMHDDDEWAAEQLRITGPMDGTAPLTERPSGEREWFVVDSYCRQQIWGTWSDGYWVEGHTALPGPSPLYPLRSTLEASCDQMFPPVQPSPGGPEEDDRRR